MLIGSPGNDDDGLLFKWLEAMRICFSGHHRGQDNKWNNFELQFLHKRE